MGEGQGEECVVLRRTKRMLGGGGDRNGNPAVPSTRRHGSVQGPGVKRLSWSISDLSQLPAGKASTMVAPRTIHQRSRNASISSCSLSSGSSNFSLRSNGSFRRKARIPVSGFAERAFLANERKMIQEPEIIVREDLEYLVKMDNSPDSVEEEDNFTVQCKDSLPRPRCESSEENVMENSKLRHPSGDLCNNSADLVDNRVVNCNVFASENSTFVQHNTATLNERTASVTSPILKSGSGTLSSSDRGSVALNTKDQEQDSGRDRGMSVSSIVSRDSLASVSSFSSSFMIDRIFHWRKSGTKSMKSPDSDTIKNFRLSSAPQHSRISLPNSNSNNNVQYQQIDKLAAESLATFNLVTEDGSDGAKSTGSHSMLPDKPIRLKGLLMDFV